MRLLTYGQRIARARTLAELTQTQLAKQIQVKRETLSRWERDRLIITPPAEEMHRLVARLPELSEAELLLSLGYVLSPLEADDDGMPVFPQRGRERRMRAQTQQLVDTYESLPPALRRVLLAQVLATKALLQESHET